MRPSHLLLAGPLLAGLIWAAATPGGVRAGAGGPRTAEPGEESLDYGAELERFRSLLAACQRGEALDEAELLASAELLARRFGRTDAPGAAAHYAGLAPEERAEGWRTFLAFRALWGRLAEADPARWPAERSALVEDLESYLAGCASLADRVPLARGLSLRARLAVHDLETRPDLGPAEREELLERARADAGRALELFGATGVASPSLEPRWLLGRLALLEERLAEAARAFDGVLGLAELLRNDDFREHALLGLLLVARKSGDAPRVQRLTAHLATFRDPRECWPLAREHALALLHSDHPEEAARFLRRTIPAAEGERGGWSLLLGLAHARLGELGAARALLEGPEAAGDESFQLALASLALGEGRAAAVVEALGDEARLAFFSPHGEMFARSLLGEARLLLGLPAAAARELERALQLAEHWEARLEEQRLLGDATATVMGEWVGLHAVARLAEAYALLERPLDAAAAIERAQSRSLRAALGEGDPAPADLVAWAARYEHGLVTLVVGADTSAVAWVAPDGGAWAAPLPRARAELTRAVRRLREAALAGDREAATRLGAELAGELLPPALRARLAAAPGGRLLLLLHGPLERLPVSLLAPDGLPLDGLCTALTLPGLPARRPGELEPGALGRWTLAGDPPARDGRPLLPAAAGELAAVHALRPDARLLAGVDLDAPALEEALLSGACLHLATHAEGRPPPSPAPPPAPPGRGVHAAPRPGAAQRLAPSALLLREGAHLDAARIAALGPRLPLVVLSACATADGRFLDAEGLQGLARAFLESGTRNLLVTLWPVTDEAAAAFAAPYHAALLAGSSPAEAAHQARAHLARAGHPLPDLAAFQALGRD